MAVKLNIWVLLVCFVVLGCSIRERNIFVKPFEGIRLAPENIGSMADVDPYPGAPWLPAQKQNATAESFEAGRHPNDVRCAVDPATARYTDLDTGEVRTWWQQRRYVEERNKRYARDLSRLRVVSSAIQALWGQKPHFYDNWFHGFIPEYRLPNPRSDLSRLEAVYGADAPQPYPPGPPPGQY